MMGVRRRPSTCQRNRETGPRPYYWARLVFFAAAILPAGPGIAFACRCTEPEPRQAYRMAESVVYGKVVSAKKEDDGADTSYVLEVAESWKQPVESQITVHTGITCAYEATVGEKYVLFLKRSNQSIYETAMCMGNRPEAKSRALLKFLRATKPQR